MAPVGKEPVKKSETTSNSLFIFSIIPDSLEYSNTLQNMTDIIRANVRPAFQTITKQDVIKWIKENKSSDLAKEAQPYLSQNANMPDSIISKVLLLKIQTLKESAKVYNSNLL
jgi:hypothetical protein